MSTIYPGVQFYAEVISGDCPQALCRTPSTYSYGSRLELAPRRNALYVMCADGSVESVWEPDRPIGWELHETPNGWSCRISQVGFAPVPCLVRYHSKAVDIRPGSHGVGSMVMLALESRPDGEIPELSIDFSRHAAIYDSPDEGEPEATSPECPGAPRKLSKNAFFS
jgi:hypothetical protein